MGFLDRFFGVLPFDLGFAGRGLGLATALGLKGGLVGFFLLMMRFLFVNGASILSILNASQKLPISFRVRDLSLYLAYNFNSLHKFKPSDLTTPNNCPKVSKLKGISFVTKFCRNLLQIRSPNNFGRPAINLSFKSLLAHLLVLQHWLEIHLCIIYNRRALGISD